MIFNFSDQSDKNLWQNRCEQRTLLRETSKEDRTEHEVCSIYGSGSKLPEERAV